MNLCFGNLSTLLFSISEITLFVERQFNFYCPFAHLPVFGVNRLLTVLYFEFSVLLEMTENS